MVAVHINDQVFKRVSFKEDALATVHYIPSLDSLPIRDMFYDSDDYERFLWERNMEIQRDMRKKVHASGYRRSTRRSSLDLMMTAAPTPKSAGPRQYYRPRDPVRTPAPNGRSYPRKGAQGTGMALAA
ncbi:expressed unknown protein [Seminavis robusta]|uniref:Uncharacterized protein n=1 Tax=Seminavis robusta TaxID=568900 RepID=A0A9N8ES79_9STRA|nr:expressed unknown protein [Seminavis robusta]|eukprot:Sro1804_g298710.1 n/a (128) ;mRNA; r:19048-19431